MTPAESRVLIDVRGYATTNRIHLTGHAAARMGQRGADLRDVRRALMSATTCKKQPNGTFRIEGGVDRDGDELTVIVAIVDGVLIVTVF